MSQKINALSLGDVALKNIGIRKGLPEAEDQALVYLFMASTQMSADDYEKLMDDFIASSLAVRMDIFAVPAIMWQKGRKISLISIRR